ncbi:MAG: dimethyl sulfoxide reductase anchor subunit [Anaerolineales bacterium]|nr:dimethyl sulfoxide reductase anchor subunit [Anaerolineales bacterium]
MKTKGWPLILFTLLSQCAVGMLLSWYTIEALGTMPLQSSQIWIIPMLITLLLTLAGSAAGLHLRRPQRAALAAANWQHSWLSREMVFALLLGSGTAMLTLLHVIQLPLMLLRLGVRLLSLLSAGLLAWSMIRLYELRTVPAWKMDTTFLTFFNTILLLGPATLLAVLVLLSEAGRGDVCTAVLFQPILLWTAGFLLFQTMVFYQSIQLLRSNGRAGRESYRIMMEENKKLVYARIGLSGVLVILLICSAYSIPAGNSLPMVVLPLLILLWIGEGIGRYLFYASYVRQGL